MDSSKVALSKVEEISSIMKSNVTLMAKNVEDVETKLLPYT